MGFDRGKYDRRKSFLRILRGVGGVLCRRKGRGNGHPRSNPVVYADWNISFCWSVSVEPNFQDGRARESSPMSSVGAARWIRRGIFSARNDSELFRVFGSWAGLRAEDGLRDRRGYLHGVSEFCGQENGLICNERFSVRVC